MGLSQIFGGCERGLTVSFNVSQYIALTNNGNIATTATEADRQEIFPTAGTISAWSVYVSANTIATSDTTIRLRNNGANGSLLITIPAGSTGWINATGGSDTVVANDLICAQITTPNTSGSLTITNQKMSYDVSGSTVMHTRIVPTTISLNGLTRYFWLNANGFAAAEAFTVLRSAGTIVGMYLTVTGSTRAVNDVFTLRKNGADQTMVVTATGNGTYTDTTHTVSIAAGDQVSLKLVTGASANSGVYNLVIEFVPSGSTQEIVGQWAQLLNQGTTNYAQIGGAQRAYTATEAQASAPIMRATVLSQGRMYVSSYSLSAGATGRIRVNGANGNQTWAINMTGEFKDLSNTDTVSSGDLVNFSLVNAAGTGTIIVASTGVSETPSGSGGFFARYYYDQPMAVGI